MNTMNDIRNRIKGQKKRLPADIPRELLIESINDHGGNLSQVAKDMDVNYVALQFFVERKKELVVLIMKHREAFVDQAEENLKLDLAQGNWRATKFTLQTIGKERGYVQRTEMENHTIIEHQEPSIDLEKLSTEQLKSLQNMMDESLTVISGETNQIVNE